MAPDQNNNNNKQHAVAGDKDGMSILSLNMADSQFELPYFDEFSQSSLFAALSISRDNHGTNRKHPRTPEDFVIEFDCARQDYNEVVPTCSTESQLVSDVQLCFSAGEKWASKIRATMNFLNYHMEEGRLEKLSLFSQFLNIRRMQNDQLRVLPDLCPPLQNIIEHLRTTICESLKTGNRTAKEYVNCCIFVAFCAHVIVGHYKYLKNSSANEVEDMSGEKLISLISRENTKVKMLSDLLDIFWIFEDFDARNHILLNAVSNQDFDWNTPVHIGVPRDDSNNQTNKIPYNYIKENYTTSTEKIKNEMRINDARTMSMLPSSINGTFAKECELARWKTLQHLNRSSTKDTKSNERRSEQQNQNVAEQDSDEETEHNNQMEDVEMEVVDNDHEDDDQTASDQEECRPSADVSIVEHIKEMFIGKIDLYMMDFANASTEAEQTEIVDYLLNKCNDL